MTYLESIYMELKERNDNPDFDDLMYAMMEDHFKNIHQQARRSDGTPTEKALAYLGGFSDALGLLEEIDCVDEGDIADKAEDWMRNQDNLFD